MHPLPRLVRIAVAALVVVQLLVSFVSSELRNAEQRANYDPQFRERLKQRMRDNEERRKRDLDAIRRGAPPVVPGWDVAGG
jgi:hypothetical protein